MALTASDITVYNIARILGHLTTDIGSLCSSVKVNRWSLRRPLGIASDEDITDAVREDNNWGYVIPEYTSIPQMMDDARTAGPAWGDNKPDALHPYYRLRDFIGYEHDAKPPFPWQCEASGNTIYKKDYLRFYLGDEEDGALDIDDFALLEDCNVGVAIRKVSSSALQTAAAVCTFDTLTADSNDAYSISPSYFNAGGSGVYEAVLFFTTLTISLEGSLSAGSFYPLPYPRFTFTYTNTTGVSIMGSALVKNDGGENLRFMLHVEQAGEVKTLTGVEIYYLSKTDYATGGPWDEGATLKKVTIGSISSSTYNSLVSFDLDGSLFPSTYTIAYVYSVGGYSYHGEVVFEEEESEDNT